MKNKCWSLNDKVCYSCKNEKKYECVLNCEHYDLQMKINGMENVLNDEKSYWYKYLVDNCR